MFSTNQDNWREIAEAARQEEDPKRLMELIAQLNRALEERDESLLRGNPPPQLDL